MALYVLFAIVIGLCGYIAWKLSSPTASADSQGDKMLREMLESLRRDLHDTKDKDRKSVV